MNEHIKTAMAIAVLGLSIYIILTGIEIHSSLKESRNTPLNPNIQRGRKLISQYNAHLESLHAEEKHEELLQKISSPFGKLKAPIKVEPPKIDFVRVPLVLEGILEGEKWVVLLKERSGKTHPLSKGETVHERTVVKITANSVILKDKIGNDTLFVE